ncbi:MAG: hypothetical protein K2Q06_16495, partial [Parvularculaceae bacterium]|nr:hypothetical protein [Parvularculaceae bacterium]
MRRLHLLGLLTLGLAAPSCARAEPACRSIEREGARYAVCAFAAGADVRLFLDDAAGAPLAEFDAVKQAVEAQGARLVFAMNAGMYTEERRPVGLYIEDGAMKRAVNRADCAGN